jgi:hypothetical protein
MSLHARRPLLTRALPGVISLLLAVLPMGPSGAQPAELPRLGDAAGDQLSPLAERRLGE